MKHFLLAALLLAGFTTACFAQTKEKTKATTSTTTTAQKEKAKTGEKQVTNADNSKTTVKSTIKEKPATSSTMAVKKDGTLDMRYKTNKEAQKTKETEKNTARLKKNGSPDMRYKENKSH
ncbi:MAG: hypothetical protein ICV51_05815 [Flavisolibacter sp.]|nr:hypothetical protein [Flavisolibacter sp.]